MQSSYSQSRFHGFPQDVSVGCAKFIFTQEISWIPSGCECRLCKVHIHKCRFIFTKEISLKMYQQFTYFNFRNRFFSFSFSFLAYNNIFIYKYYFNVHKGMYAYAYPYMLILMLICLCMYVCMYVCM